MPKVEMSPPWLSQHPEHLHDVGDGTPYMSLKDSEEKTSDDISFDDVASYTEAIPPRGGVRMAWRRRLKHCLGHIHLGSFHFLLPSFFQKGTGRTKRLHSSAWLDGLRGIAAFFVVLHHSSLLWFSWNIHGGWNVSSDQTAWILRLPIIRLIISGPAQVRIFFVVSGYAISYKPLKLARQGRFAEVGSALSSSVFRRHSRLFMPAAVVTLWSVIMTQLDPNWFGSDGFPGAAVPVRVPPHGRNLMEQLWHFRDVEIQATNPIYQGLAQGSDSRVFNNPYDANLWTLPMEFSSSMVIFMFLTAFTRVRNRVRMFFNLAIIVYFHYYFIYWALFPFLCGMLICDLHLELEEIRAKSNEEFDPNEAVALPTWARVQRRFGSKLIAKTRRLFSGFSGRIIGSLAFFASLWLLSTPDSWLGAQDSWGYMTLTSWIPDNFQDQLLMPCGAVMLVLVVDLFPFLQVLFTNPFSQYMGRISYALYLIHGPLLWSLALKFTHYMLNITGSGTPEQYIWAVLVAACLWWIIAIYFSDILARLVDEKCVRFGKWAYEKLLKDE
ncbi:acyltransferase family-domain-containing protein [Coniella lustricola]|uniref:Acyltransferase family-domain-containing protein n=1 Tax=Coniella lustricola TaxID=2025994 RepID=A0A2T2ZUX5_9PEZI|nr:acyltransferase family-domain-containing protein [Coniella lustricola]